jgi:hypothetical protein
VDAGDSQGPKSNTSLLLIFGNERRCL